MKNINTKVICGFPGVGKTYAYEKLQDKLKVMDSDSSNFSWTDYTKKVRNPEFPKNYINHIKDNMGKVDLIFVSTHKAVLDELDNNDISYEIICPEKDLKQLYEIIYLSRGNTEEFVNLIMNKWDDFFKDMESSKNSGIHYLDENETLYDYITKKYGIV